MSFNFLFFFILFFSKFFQLLVIGILVILSNGPGVELSLLPDSELLVVLVECVRHRFRFLLVLLVLLLDCWLLTFDIFSLPFFSLVLLHVTFNLFNLLLDVSGYGFTPVVRASAFFLIVSPPRCLIVSAPPVELPLSSVPSPAASAASAWSSINPSFTITAFFFVEPPRGTITEFALSVKSSRRPFSIKLPHSPVSALFVPVVTAVSVVLATGCWLVTR